MFSCGGPLENSAGMDGILESNFEASKKILKDVGYDGTPIVLLQSTDLAVLTNLAPVAKTLLERGGFKVDMQSMDWQTLVGRRSKKDPIAQGGWNIAMTAAAAVLLIDPINNHYAEASGDRAQFGWPLDDEIEKLRLDFVREADAKKPRKILITNRTHWEAHHILKVYKRRWTGTETFHRDGKQQLGMGECQLRSGLGQTRHMHLVVLVYSAWIATVEARPRSGMGSQTLDDHRRVLSFHCS